MSEAPFTLRVAGPDDARQVTDVLTASYGTLYRGWYRDDVLAGALPAMTRARPELLVSKRYFLCEQRGRAIACGGWSLGDPRGAAVEGRGHIRHFGTHPEHLGLGCGTAIIERCLNEARAEGCMEMECLSSLTAEAFYAGRGFNTVGAASVTIGGVAFACMLMRRRL
ncbi:MAG: GNAT family N-acetyltransferase [Parvularculaceae bacterium]|nr:GNAT family N-acetyltransferase [Parvularculaceae bacterium]